jgi:hypothetical protein
VWWSRLWPFCLSPHLLRHQSAPLKLPARCSAHAWSRAGCRGARVRSLLGGAPAAVGGGPGACQLR